MYFQSVVMNVADLDRSIDFYCEVFGFNLLSRKDQLAALNAQGADRPQVIILRSYGRSSGGRIGGARHVGIRALVIEVDTPEEVDRIEAELDKRGTLVNRHGDGSTWTAVFGRDPDQIAVVAGASMTGNPIALDAWAALDDALYGVGE